MAEFEIGSARGSTVRLSSTLVDWQGQSDTETRGRGRLSDVPEGSERALATYRRHGFVDAGAMFDTSPGAGRGT